MTAPGRELLQNDGGAFEPDAVVVNGHSFQQKPHLRLPQFGWPFGQTTAHFQMRLEVEAEVAGGQQAEKGHDLGRKGPRQSAHVPPWRQA